MEARIQAQDATAAAEAGAVAAADVEALEARVREEENRRLLLLAGESGAGYTINRSACLSPFSNV